MHKKIIVSPGITGLQQIVDALATDNTNCVFVDETSKAKSDSFGELLKGASEVTALAHLGDDDSNIRIDWSRIVEVQHRAPTEGNLNGVLSGGLYIPVERREETLHALRQFLDSSQIRTSSRAATQAATHALVVNGIAVRPLDIFPLDQKPNLSVHSLRLRRASRGNDGLVSTVLIRPVSRQLTRLSVALQVTPNVLTWASLVVSLGAAALYGLGTEIATISAALAMFIALVFDCSDGEVARYTGRSSAFGAWFDAFTDRIKEHALIAGLAVGASVQGQDAWLVAIMAVMVMTLRHVSTFAFIDTVLPDHNRSADSKQHSMASQKWTHRPGLTQTSFKGWLSRVLHAPVSERWAVLAVVALTANAWWAVVSYGIYVLISLLLTTAGWLRRTRRITKRLDPSTVRILSTLRDDSRLRTESHRSASWLSVPITTAIEIGFLLLMAWAGADAHDGEFIAVLSYVAVVLVSWIRYDRAYASSQRQQSSYTLPTLGWGMRSLLWAGCFISVLFGYETLAICVSLAIVVFLLVMVTAGTWRTTRGLFARSNVASNKN